MQLELDRYALGRCDLTAAPAQEPTATSLLTANVYLAWLLGMQ